MIVNITIVTNREFKPTPSPQAYGVHTSDSYGALRYRITTISQITPP